MYIGGTGVCSGQCLLGDVHMRMLGFVQVGTDIDVHVDVIDRLVVWCGVCWPFWSLLNAVLVAPVPQIAARSVE